MAKKNKLMSQGAIGAAENLCKEMTQSLATSLSGRNIKEAIDIGNLAISALIHNYLDGISQLTDKDRIRAIEHMVHITISMLKKTREDKIDMVM